MPARLIPNAPPLPSPVTIGDLIDLANGVPESEVIPLVLAFFPKVEELSRGHDVAVFHRHLVGNPPMGTVLLLIWSTDHFSDLRVHSYERSYDGIWAAGGGFDGTGTAPAVERRSEAGNRRGI
jgi:hypothetical protein